MKLVIGLGNPGKEYFNTRHNVGFRFLDYYLNSIHLNPSWTMKFNGLFFLTSIYGHKVIFLKPQTFMNLSGDCVKKFIDYYQIDIEDILVISDDLDLNIGNFKLKLFGSCGGHNGLRDIELKIHSCGYKRLKIGISKNSEVDTKNYVLGCFSLEENKILEDEFVLLTDVLNDYFLLSFNDLMSKYNHKNK